MAEAPAKSAAQLRADKRNAKIRAGAGSRIASITTSARGEEGSAYLNSASLSLSSNCLMLNIEAEPTPFETRQAPAASGLDPDDIDLSSLAPSTSPRNDPFRASLNPELSGEGGQDLMSMLASMSGSTNASGMPELPPEFANNPLMAALSQMGGGAGGTMPQGMPQMGQMGEAKPKSLLERSLPLLHFVSMVGLVVWAVLRGEGVTWSRLPFVGESNKEWAAEAMGIVRPVVSPTLAVG